MRKMMTKEVTETTVQVARMTVVDGQPKAEQLEDQVLLGNVTQEKAQKDLNKKFGFPVTVFNIEANTLVYEMPVEDFIKYATIKVDAVEDDSALEEQA